MYIYICIYYVYRWVMQRLRGLGSDPRGRKRLHVIKVFIALVIVEKATFIVNNLPQMIEVALRVRLFGGKRADAMDGLEDQSAGQSQSELANIKESKEAASELLDLLEKKVGSATLLGKYAEVQRRLQVNL
jgi:hypothetical protein